MKRKIGSLAAGIMLLAAAGNVFAADVNVFGDVFFWPRFESTTRTNNAEGAPITEQVESNFQLMYRAVIGMHMDWQEGFSGRLKLANDNAANIIVMPGRANAIIEEASLSWDRDGLKITGGRLLLGAYTGSVVMDAHFNPANPVDAAFAVFQRGIIDGLSVDYKLSDQVALTGIMANLANVTSIAYSGPDTPEDLENVDQNAVGVLSTIVLDDLRLWPGVVMTLPATIARQPQPVRTSYGLNAQYMLNGIALRAGVVMTSALVEEDGDDGTAANHVKNDTTMYKAGLGWSNWSLMFDYATRNDSAWDAVAGDWADEETSIDIMNIALTYNHVLAPGVSIQPRIKYLTQNYGRATDATFDEVARLRLEVLCIGRF